MLLTLILASVYAYALSGYIIQSQWEELCWCERLLVGVFWLPFFTFCLVLVLAYMAINGPGMIRQYFQTKRIAAKYGCTVVEDVQHSKFKVKDLEYISYLFEHGRNKNNGGMMDFTDVRRRAVYLKGNFGLLDGEHILKDQEAIPKWLRGNKYITLTGTLLRNSNGDTGIMFLYWDGESWKMMFHDSDLKFFDYFSLPRHNPAFTAQVHQGGRMAC